MNLDYKLVSSTEGTSSFGSLGIQVLVALKRELTETETDMIAEAVSKIRQSIHYNTVAMDPDIIQVYAERKEKIIALFDEPIFVEEIPNGYSDTIPSPWFIVTTRIGRIKIGWRKRVINIDWSDSLNKKSGAQLFPDEDVTKGNKYDSVPQMIHAWGYEKAREYINVIMEQL